MFGVKILILQGLILANPVAKLPVLMYHKISASQSKGLTIASEILEEQLLWLKEKGYHSHHLSQVVDLVKFPNKKNIVLTFDDAYVSQLEFAYPLLQKYGFKATFFVPLKYVGIADTWNKKAQPIMTAAQLRSLDPSVIELAYHSYAHEAYNEMSIEAIEEDTLLAFKTAQELELALGPYLAYPYGKFPRKDPEKSEFNAFLHEHKFKLGLRIGNRVNDFPIRDVFEVQRVDVRGEWSLKKFKRKIKWGKLV